MVQQTVWIHRNYGRITYHFQDVMDQKGINRNQLARFANIRFEVASRYYHGQIERMDMDVLARILFVLDCAVSDVIQYNKGVFMNYEKSYYFLFNKITDIIEGLKQIQQQAEELIIAQNESSENTDEQL